jgi:signal transduction histidine kinase
MIQVRSMRFRMMVLFSGVVGVLLASSYLGFYALLAREVRAQLDRQLLDAARPVVADLSADPTEEDVNQLNIPGEYFELLDRSGRVLQKSKNLDALDLGAREFDASRPAFGNVHDERRGGLRFVLVPFAQAGEPRFLLLAIPSREAREVLATFQQIIWFLLPLSLVLTAVISAWYVGRSLRPIAELTRHAAQMTARVTDAERRDLWAPLKVSNPHEELGRLAETFNQLFARVDAALRQLRQFVTDASHELRTPLSVLHGETELMLSEPRTAEEYQGTLRVIDGELKKLSRIVEGLFTLAMADAGQLRLAREPLYLNEVLEETCVMAGPLAQTKGIVIERELNQEVAYQGDEVFLRQLFLEFLENAIKYSRPNTRVRVELEKSNGLVRARFQDQGAGIASQHLPRIFERFYRAPVLTESGPGAGEPHSGGLGLAIAQAIARAQGGSIQCQSAPGSGSTFTVSLPVDNT